MAPCGLLFYYCVKELMGNWCPHIKKACREDCVYFIEYIIQPDAKPGEPAPKPIPCKDCQVNYSGALLAQILHRLYGVQGATEQTRDKTDELHKFFQGALRTC